MNKQSCLKLMSMAAILGCVLCGCKGGGREQAGDGFASIAESFKNPPSEYRTFPFAVWNDKMSEEGIDRQLEDMKAQGCGGVIIHPRPGLITEYLSDEWFSLYKHAVSKAESLGMEIWIYDENSYPSGFAGGHVPARMPESYDLGEGLALTKTDILPPDADSCFICLKKEGDSWEDITADLSLFKGSPGEYYLYRKTYERKSDWYGGFSYVDLMKPGVTDKFLEITMSGYEKAFPDEFGKTIKGVFSDEPNIATPGGIRWTPGLFAEFQKRWGYDLKPLLPLLQEETGDWKRVRHNYMQTLLDLFIENWSKPFSAYCTRHGLKWTGHYWEHDWPNMNQGPDNMAMYAWHQMPGIDMLFNQFNEENPQAQFGNVRSVKELRSVANQMGYSRTLSETYGGGGWDETFKDFKRLGDWEYVLGVNFMNQHLSHATLSGARKYDYPPVFSYHSPWWEDYGGINDYFGRLSLVLSKGTQNNNLLILEPNSTIWSYFSHSGSDPKLFEIGKSFQDFVTMLEKNQVEYDLGSENIIKDHGSVEDGHLVVGDAAYSTVVLPPMMENLNKPVFDLLVEFLKEGGNLLAFSSPSLIDGAPNDKLAEVMSNFAVIPGLDEEVIRDKFNDFMPVLSFSGGDLYHQRREYSDGELIFLVNSSMEEPVKGSLELSGKSVVRMDALTGEIYSYDAVSGQGDTLKADFELEPAVSLVLFFSKRNLKYPQAPAIAGHEKVPANSGVVVKRLRDNVLNVDFCDLTVKGKAYKNLYFASAADIAFKEHGFANGNPWNTSVQYKRNILDRDTFSDGGFKVTYRFTINEDFDYSGFKLVSEKPEIFSVSVNGNPVKPADGEWWLDRSFGVYHIGNVVHKGINVVGVSVSPMSVFAEIEPIYILGDFSVSPEKLGWSISAPVGNMGLGSWKTQGQPFYSWDVSYVKEYVIDDLTRPYSISLNKWNGTVAEVFVNGEKAGSIGFDPFRLDISKFLKKGVNEIDVRVVGSHANLLGPFYSTSTHGLASPWHWKNVKNDIPGNDYRMYDYGLMEDYDLEK
ncbi:MAG: glycosyl hydrolase [Candidatus Cryptobacteroides sp.]|nr:glycosyl hydrolase [Candidatus Cryptobacteroides sp.]MEE3429976.1 glycosyl hydrolase [Candidatus Cryptobacteroides sp.]